MQAHIDDAALRLQDTVCGWFEVPHLYENQRPKNKPSNETPNYAETNDSEEVYAPDETTQ